MGWTRLLEVDGEIEEGSIRLRSPAAPEGGADEIGRVTPLRMTVARTGVSPGESEHNMLWLTIGWLIEVLLGRLATGATDEGLKVRLAAGSLRLCRDRSAARRLRSAQPGMAVPRSCAGS
jgi:hypothetical protein